MSYNINVTSEMFEIKTVTETFDIVRCTQGADPYFRHPWTAILLQNSDIIFQEFLVIKIYFTHCGLLKHHKSTNGLWTKVSSAKELLQGCTNLGRQVDMETKFCTLTP
jgi:hypothetical protein